MMQEEEIEKAGKGGVVRVPIGFRFRPTDEELVVHYLKRKVYSLPLPASVIPELDDVFKANPWDLPPGEPREKIRYFFFSLFGRTKVENVKRRSAGCGYWKSLSQHKQHIIGSNRQIIGIKKSFRFYRKGGIRTRWLMHLYSLPKNFDWLVCRIYQMRRRNGSNKRGCNATSSNVLLYSESRDLGDPAAHQHTSSSPSSSCSSAITCDIVVSSSSSSSLTDHLDQEVTSRDLTTT